MRRTATVFALVLLAGLVATPALAQVTPPPGPAFHHLDTDADGRVTLSEVLACATAQAAKGRPFRVADLDRDRDGRISPEEFRRAGVRGFEDLGAVDVRELDADGDGTVSRRELDEYFRRRAEAQFRNADSNADGSLSRSEFVLLRF